MNCKKEVPNEMSASSFATFPKSVHVSIDLVAGYKAAKKINGAEPDVPSYYKWWGNHAQAGEHCSIDQQKPEEATEPLKISVYSLAVMKGMDKPKRPTFKKNQYSRERERE